MGELREAYAKAKMTRYIYRPLHLSLERERKFQACARDRKVQLEKSKSALDAARANMTGLESEMKNAQTLCDAEEIYRRAKVAHAKYRSAGGARSFATFDDLLKSKRDEV